jgi:pyruvate,water dikinase
LLIANSEILEIISRLEETLQGRHLFGIAYIRSASARALSRTDRMIRTINHLSGDRYEALYGILNNITHGIDEALRQGQETEADTLTRGFDLIPDRIHFLDGMDKKESMIPEKEDIAKKRYPLPGYPLLVERGVAAFPGVGCGPAFHVRSDEDLSAFPEGAVLIAAHSSPKFTVVMGKARAIVTDAGSVTGHMATIARESGVPCLLNTEVATHVIPHHAMITVDASACRVYQGMVAELLTQKGDRTSPIKGTALYQTLRKVANLIIPLHLLDPKAPDFGPESCKWIHDIARLIHEVSYSEMFHISDLISGDATEAVKLDAPLPLDLHIIDMEGGLKKGVGNQKGVGVEQIVSVPLKAFLKGLMHKDLLWREPRPIHIRGFLSVMAEQMLSPPASASDSFGGPSYAIISDRYLNFSSRVGYHYSVLDAFCGEVINNNYIRFSFKGGAADEIRRSRRARAIAMMLDALGFSVVVTGDRVSARFQKYERAIIEEKLEMVGRLLQFTRQMDMLMDREASVGFVADAFLRGDYRLKNWGSKGPSRRETGI